MSQSQERLTLRISSTLVEQLDQLADDLAALPAWSPTGKMSRSECLRHCIVRGLADIKRELEEHDKP